MPSFDITLLTASDYLDDSNLDEFHQNIILEDTILQKALKSKGLKVHRTNWDNPDFDFSHTKFALFRATWDYFHRIEEFKEWLEETKSQTQFINSAETVFWNLDKHYLQDLETSGINIPNTIFIEKKEKISLQEIVIKNNWKEFILKPAVAGAARHTYRFAQNQAEKHEPIFQKLIQKEAMLLQEFQTNIIEKGEISLMFFGENYSHSVLKKAKAGDFRVQDDFGGTVHDYEPNSEEIAFAKKALAACNPQPTYARVDILWDNQGELCLGELELIEPELWFRKSENAAEILADEILKTYF